MVVAAISSWLLGGGCAARHEPSCSLVLMCLIVFKARTQPHMFEPALWLLVMGTQQLRQPAGSAWLGPTAYIMMLLLCVQASL